MSAMLMPLKLTHKHVCQAGLAKASPIQNTAGHRRVPAARARRRKRNAKVEKIVGVGAPLELLEHLKRIADAHNPQMEVDCLRYMVEAEVVMPLHYTLREVHDISLELQNRLEALDLVERAFVHVDYERRMEPEHRTERLLAGLPVLAEQTVFSSDSGRPMHTVADSSGYGVRLQPDGSAEQLGLAGPGRISSRSSSNNRSSRNSRSGQQQQQQQQLDSIFTFNNHEGGPRTEGMWCHCAGQRWQWAAAPGQRPEAGQLLGLLASRGSCTRSPGLRKCLASNAALNMQRIGESKWRPLELCWWPEQGALPAKGKEYPGLGYKRLRDKPPKAQQQQPAVAQ
ncbi:hypothetical protein QJQ45_010464 [Haematococcus lacustris]|nr:hypothetical protein QJQ45_010464 [Haematococcus lacustris]